MPILAIVYTSCLRYEKSNSAMPPVLEAISDMCQVSAVSLHSSEFLSLTNAAHIIITKAKHETNIN